MGTRQAVSEAISSSVNTAERRCCIPIRPMTFRTFFLSDILMASFMEISHFPVHPRERRRTPLLSKGYRQGNTSALMLFGVFKAGRPQKDGNESVRSCKNECQKENESGIGNELRILWDPCVCKGFVSYHPPPSLCLSSTSSSSSSSFPQVVMSQRLGSSLRRKVSETETQLLALHEAKLAAISGKICTQPHPDANLPTFHIFYLPHLTKKPTISPV